ncbi:MAG: glucosamine-1-phosphate N-acetyltransferase [Oscillospiraceae bacterium]|nr:glucosamine-1-phosphate N-acetyltransferase [Oscillospiraceae bacterium]
MDFRNVYIDLCTGETAGEKPLMLTEVLFCPALFWVCKELLNRGVQRFFVVCDQSWKEEVERVLSSVEGVQVFTDAAAGRAAAGACVSFTGAVLPVNGSEAQFGWLKVESRAELLAAAARCRAAVCEKLARQGVIFIDPNTTYIDPRAEIGAGTVVLPNTIIRGASVVGEHCELGPNTMIRDCTVGDYTTINASQINESTIGSHTTVGPFAYVRPNCSVGDHCRIGDFVELKNSSLDEGTKVSHLTYVGDSDVGKRVNFGCGTVTTNYDGVKKYRCTIGDDVFLGCNTNLIAPVEIGEGAYTAAGSTVTEDVPAGALAVARARQENKPGWVKKFFAKKR